MKNTGILILGLFLATVTAAFAQDNISPRRKQAIDSLALEKVKDLSKYISIIGNKETQFSEANRVMDRAEELFAAGAEMGVSSINTQEIAYYKVRRYFERLMALNYDKVNITWYDIQYVSDLGVNLMVVMWVSLLFISVLRVPPLKLA